MTDEEFNKTSANIEEFVAAQGQTLADKSKSKPSPGSAVPPAPSGGTPADRKNPDVYGFAPDDPSDKPPAELKPGKRFRVTSKSPDGTTSTRTVSASDEEDARHKAEALGNTVLGVQEVGGSRGGRGGIGGGRGGSGDGADLNVNIVSPLPIPVHVVSWASGGGGEGGGGGPPSPTSGDHTPMRPGDPADQRLGGLTAQQQFESVFSGGYAAGYPIHNLGNLATRLKGVGSEMFGKFGQIGRGLNTASGGQLGHAWDLAKAHLGGSKIGRMFKGAGGWYKDASRGFLSNLGRKAQSLLGGKYGAPSKAGAGTRGASAAGAGRAAGMAGAAAGGGEAMAMGGARAAAALGPVGAVAAGVTALGVAAYKATQEIYSFARAQEQEVRRLSEVGGDQAAAIAILDYRREERDIDMATRTGTSAETLTQGINAFEQALQPIQVAATDIANTVGGELLSLIATMVEPLGELAEKVIEFINWWRGNEARKRPETMWQAYERFAEEGRRADTPQWPGAAPRPDTFR